MEGHKNQFLEIMKFVIPGIVFPIAAYGSEKWVLTYGLFLITFGLIVISEQIERLIKYLTIKE